VFLLGAAAAVVAGAAVVQDAELALLQAADF
jgi:hypothetical protein